MPIDYSEHQSEPVIQGQSIICLIRAPLVKNEGIIIASGKTDFIILDGAGGGGGTSFCTLTLRKDLKCIEMIPRYSPIL